MDTPSQNLIFNHSLHHFTYCFLFLLISLSTHITFIAHGRILQDPNGISNDLMKGEKMILKGQIGSRPPRCEKRCISCAHCEAIQVPTNPQIKFGKGAKKKNFLSKKNSRGSDDDNYSNYKPMSWKCKCGNFIYNP